MSKKLKTVVDPLLKIDDEQTFEAFYNFALTPWLGLTCNLQIIRPALRASEMAVVPGARLVVNF